jgi:2-keto-4-pentenoate hydratase
MRRQLAADLGERIGWKMALNAPALMERLGLPEPALGQLLRDRVAEGRHSLTGATFAAVEPELAIEVGDGGAVARLGAALEIVDFDKPLDDLEDVIATNVFHRAVAVGELVEPAALGAVRFSLSDDTIEPEDPQETMRFASELLARFGEALKPGDLIIAGALAPAAPIQPGGVARVEIEPLPPVELEFE